MLIYQSKNGSVTVVLSNLNNPLINSLTGDYLNVQGSFNTKIFGLPVGVSGNIGGNFNDGKWRNKNSYYGGAVSEFGSINLTPNFMNLSYLLDMKINFEVSLQSRSTYKIGR